MLCFALVVFFFCFVLFCSVISTKPELHLFGDRPNENPNWPQGREKFFPILRWKLENCFERIKLTAPVYCIKLAIYYCFGKFFFCFAVSCVCGTKSNPPIKRQLVSFGGQSVTPRCPTSILTSRDLRSDMVHIFPLHPSAGFPGRNWWVEASRSKIPNTTQTNDSLFHTG